MKKLNLIAFVLCLFFVAKNVNAQQATKVVKKAPVASDKLSMDKEAIKSMAGIYKVSFDFAETFSPDTAYKYHNRYREWGIEYVFVEEETDTKIVLQHLLIVNDTMIIKHWRQDWLFENTAIYNYYKDNEWVKKTLTAEEAKGTWTQKVYQVDDSPRYENQGTWVFVDGKKYWEGVNDSPLPRREHTKRSDYNVMRRHSHIEIFQDGWVLEQDNEKIQRANGMDKLLCWEKGIERFTKGSYDATPGVKYWEKEKKYWADVRKVWDEVYAKTPDLKLAARVDNQALYMKLFELGSKTCKDNKYVAGSAVNEIKQIINSYIKS